MKKRSVGERTVIYLDDGEYQPVKEKVYKLTHTVWCDENGRMTNSLHRIEDSKNLMDCVMCDPDSQEYNNNVERVEEASCRLLEGLLKHNHDLSEAFKVPLDERQEAYMPKSLKYKSILNPKDE